MTTLPQMMTRTGTRMRILGENLFSRQKWGNSITLITLSRSLCPDGKNMCSDGPRSNQPAFKPSKRTLTFSSAGTASYSAKVSTKSQRPQFPKIVPTKKLETIDVHCPAKKHNTRSSIGFFLRSWTLQSKRK